jgi:hypothetical protein
MAPHFLHEQDTIGEIFELLDLRYKFTGQK